MKSNAFILRIFVFFFFLSTSFSFTQNAKKADSLLVLLRGTDLSKERQSELYNQIAFFHENLDTSLLLAKKSLKIAKEIESTELQAAALEEISHVQRGLGNNNLSIEATLKALRIYEKLGRTEQQAATYNQLAINHMQDENYSLGISFLKKALDIYATSDKVGNQLATVLNLGEMYRLEGHLDSATVCFKKVLSHEKTDIPKSLIAYSQGNLGMVFNTKDSLQLAERYLLDAISIVKELGDSYATSVYMAELGNVYQKQGDSNASESQLLAALTIAKKEGLKDQIRDFSRKLTQLYEAIGKYDQALHYQKMFQVYQDSLVNKANIQGIERIKASYEIDKRESEIGLLNTINTNQRYLLLALGGGVFVTLIFLYLLFRGNKKIQKANSDLSRQKEIISYREQEKALLLKELNHRVKNNLQMIASLLSLQGYELTGHPAKEAILAGKDRVEALALVHRKLYQEGIDTRIALREYVEELIWGLFHGYQVKFEPELAIEDTTISVDTAIPLALIINELVVNAIKYAFVDSTHPRLTIKIEELGSILQLEVIDNGKGFLLNTEIKEHSFGLKLITSLINQLEGSLKKKDVEGTHWLIELKNEVNTTEWTSNETQKNEVFQASRISTNKKRTSTQNI